VVVAEAVIVDRADAGAPIAGLRCDEAKLLDDGGRVATADGEPGHLVAKGGGAIRAVGKVDAALRQPRREYARGDRDRQSHHDGNGENHSMCPLCA
jgi:hypothetical protein